MKFEINVHEEDFTSFQKYVLSGLSSGLRPGEQKVSKFNLTLFLVMVVYGIMVAVYFKSRVFDWASGGAVIILILLLAIYFVALQIKQSKLTAPIEGGVVTGKKTFYLDDLGIKEVSDNYESHTKWPAVQRVVSTESHTFIFLDTLAAHIIPHNSFSSDESIESMVSYINEKLAS